MSQNSVPLAQELPIAGESPRWGQSIPYDRFLDCVHCGLCTAACPTYLETGNENDSPRGRIYLMRAVTDGRLPLTENVSRHLDLCLDCRSCETACPSGVQYGRLIEPFRVEMQQRIPSRSGEQVASWFEKFILHGLFPYPDRVRWSLWPARLMQGLGLDRLSAAVGLNRLLPQPLQRMQRLLPKLGKPLPQLPEILPPHGPRRARVALFTGCVADAMFRQVHWATARVLQANGCEVVVPRDQACCGAIHYHSGAAAPALQLARQNARSMERVGVDAVLVNVAGCGSMLKDYGHLAEEAASHDHALAQVLTKFGQQVQDISEFLVKLGPVAPTLPVPVTATYHDACHLCHAQKIREQPRQLLGLIPELKLVPLAESDICCGAAGSYNLTQPEMADRLGERKVRHILATGAQVVVSANAGCTLQILTMLKQAGRTDIEVLHPMELLDRSYGLPR
jgi:glycolate oxidase iron-sulfur subunit